LKILITDPISKEAAKEIGEMGELELAPAISPEELLEKIADVEILVVRSRTKVTSELISSAKNLKAVIRAGVGLDNIDMEAAKENGIKVLNTPEAPTQSVAELTMGLMLNLSRNICSANASTKAGKWEKGSLSGIELSGKTLGIIGFGRVGRIVSELASAFGMEVLAYDPYSPEEEMQKASVKRSELSELLSSSDIISLHAPLTKETQELLGENEFSQMKDGVLIVNAARAELLDEEAFYSAIESGKIGRAALDVYWGKKASEKLLSYRDRILFTPHLGSSTVEAKERIGKLLVERVKDLV
jgi:D-3-phosphoglycerate dehydrogenase|tara:strand:- start:17535 stop:18437 length:903 start_codon:yes stop_codon:yes gene_type:complete